MLKIVCILYLSKGKTSTKENFMSRKQLTKKEAVALFRETHTNLPKGDAVARSEAWNNFIDALHTDKVISEKAYNNWTCP